MYQNKDALAFIVGHELAHLLLGHSQITLENNIRIEKLKQQAQAARQMANQQRYISSIENALGNYYSSTGSSISGIANDISATMAEKEINKIYVQERQLEIDADTEAVTLITKAGYNPDNAKDTFEFLANLPNVYTKRSTHPDFSTRNNNLNEAINLNDSEDLRNQGRKALIESNILDIKSSSDKLTIILSKANNVKKVQYIPASKEEKMIIKAYEYYKKDDYHNAKDLFTKAFVINHNNYIPALYLSYINEYEYKQKSDKKSLKKAWHWIKKAKGAAGTNNTYVNKQLQDLKDIYLTIKEQKNIKDE